MRSWTWIAVALLVTSLAGCLAETNDLERPGQAGSPSLAPGDSLGTQYLQFDGERTWMQADQEDGPNLLLALTPAEPVATVLFPLEPTLAKDIETLGFGLAYITRESNAIGVSSQLNIEGRILVDGEASGFADLSSNDASMAIPMPTQVAAGSEVALELRFSGADVGARTVSVNMNGDSWLQVPGPSGGDGGFARGEVRITQNGNQVVAARTDVLVIPNANTEGSTIEAGTVNGGIVAHENEDRDDAVVQAELSAWGSTEQQARDELETLWVESHVNGDDPLLLRAFIRTTDTAQDRWSNKAGSLDIALPEGRVKLANLDTTNGQISWQGLDAHDVSIDTTNGAIELRDSAISSLSADSTNGQILATLKAPTSSGDYELDTTNGAITLEIATTGDNGFDAMGDTTNGDVTFSFIDSQPIGEQEDNAKHVRTNGFESKAVQTTIAMDTTNGAITAGN